MTELSNVTAIFEHRAPQGATQAANAVLETLANEITAANEKAKGASRASLRLYRTVGEKLNAAKTAAGHRNFGAWAESKGYKREWRRHLMSLAKHWNILEPYLEGDGWEGVGYSVKEACKIIDEHLGRGSKPKTDEQASEGETPENSPAERACGNRSAVIASAHLPQAESVAPPQAEVSQTEPTKLPLAEENARLSAELKAAHERIETLLREKADLKAEIADLKANEANIRSGGYLM